MAKVHGCPAPGCKQKREQWALTCYQCWRNVPEDLKQVLNSYRPGTNGRRRAARAILRWFVKPQRTL